MSARSGRTVAPGTAGYGEVAAAFSRRLAPVVEHIGPGGPARGRVAEHHLGYVRMLAWETGPLHLSGGGGDAVALVVPRHGTVRLAQDGRGVRAEGGQPVLLDLRRAFSVEQRDRAGVLLLRVPVHALHVPVARLRSVTARPQPPGGGMAALLATLLPRLERSAARVPAAVGERLGGIVTELVAALVDELTEAADEPAESGRERLVIAVRRYIDRRLEDPGLSAERIASAHLISVRYLHRLFEGEGITVGRLIQRRRVEECARELARRGRVSPSIAVVAARWGFASAAHFSRAFKAIHGHAPQQWLRRTVPPTPGTEPENRSTDATRTP